METVSVIAYHQPVTRPEIEEIRGVSLSRGTLDLLIEMGWVRPRGRRRTPGKPLTYGVTEAFLSHFGLASLDALPGKDDLKEMGYSDARADAAFEALTPGAAPSDEEEPLDGDAAAPTFYVEFAAREE
jgi:segregation and condensation protein B